MSADTVVPNPANPQDLNRYAYVRNNPLKYTDPTGYFSDQEIIDFFGVDTWFDVLALFDPGGALEGKWNWLRILKVASEGDAVQINYWNGSDVDLTLFEGYFRISEDGNLYLEGVRAGNHCKLSIFEAGQLEYANVWGAFVHYYYHGPNRERRIPMPGGARWIYMGEGLYNPGDRFHFDSSRVDWVGAGLDATGIAASIFEPHPLAMIAGWRSAVAGFARTVGQMETGQADIIDLVLDIGSFVPRLGAVFDAASLLKGLGQGVRVAP